MSSTWAEVRGSRFFPARAPGNPPFRPYPQRGDDEGYRCGSCWHRLASHLYEHADLRFAPHPGTYWCQACGEFCLRASVWTPKRKLATSRLPHQE